MAIIKVANRAIDLDAAEIPNLDASKITTGNFDASRIGSGTFADARISQSSVSQHAQSFDDNKLVNDISTLALRQSSNDNRAAYNTNSMYVDVFQDATGITNLTNTLRDSGEFISSGDSGTVGDTSNLNLLLHFDNNTNDSSGNSNNPTGTFGNIGFSTSTKKFGTHSASFDGSGNVTGTAAIQANTISSTELVSAVTLEIKDSGGSTVKTIIGAGS